MNTKIRLGLTAALVVGVTLVAGTPSWAREMYRFGLFAVGDEPEATGQATVVIVPTKPVCRQCPPNGRTENWKITLSCQHLTPGATYWSPVGTFIANGSGSAKVTITFEVWYSDPWDNGGWYIVDELEVWRDNEDGTGTLVLDLYY